MRTLQDTSVAFARRSRGHFKTDGSQTSRLNLPRRMAPDFGSALSWPHPPNPAASWPHAPGPSLESSVRDWKHTREAYCANSRADNRVPVRGSETERRLQIPTTEQLGGCQILPVIPHHKRSRPPKSPGIPTRAQRPIWTNASEDSWDARQLRTNCFEYDDQCRMESSAESGGMPQWMSSVHSVSTNKTRRAGIQTFVDQTRYEDPPSWSTNKSRNKFVKEMLCGDGDCLKNGPLGPTRKLKPIERKGAHEECWLRIDAYVENSYRDLP
eukprot:TRINITY_DN49154_c0_g1_i2.p1 TRINITY_DN49154_c0_g1~~TRINITY_DN49154_c0_g1_i2.p1  ORF type:complete len:269 (+),score=20.57 TRINITY_DN49154_c0_g1_i2:253-1059(+)